MNVLSLVLSRQQTFLLHVAAVMMVICCSFAVALPRAEAAELTTAQREAILNLLSSFNADSNVINNVRAALEGKSSPSSAASMPGTRPASVKEPGMNSVGDSRGMSACALLVRTLRKGSSGDDVLTLQRYLKQTGDLTLESTTNYFGPATEGALQAWQKRMGVVSEGDADSTGFGAMGPRTREALVAHCKQVLSDEGFSNAPYGYGANTTISSTTPPTCTLTASKDVIQAGDTVVLMWKSQNATYAGSPSGEKDPTYGARKLMPTETTTYLKRVYGPAGEGSCTKTVEVMGTTPAAEQKVVIVPTKLDVGHVVSLMGSGLAAVYEGYMGLFDFK